MNKEKNDSKIIKTYRWLKTEKGKKYSFVIFYTIFFIFLFVFVGITNNMLDDVKDDTSIEEELTLLFNIKNIENNYNLKYTISSDIKSIYEGNKINNDIKLTKDDKTYSYSYNDGKLVSNNESEEILFKLLDIYEFKRIIKTSTYISKTELASGEIIYSYSIPSNTLGSYLEMDVENVLDNNIIVSTDKDNCIKSVKYELSNLMNKNYDILIEYEDINE